MALTLCLRLLTGLMGVTGLMSAGVQQPRNRNESAGINCPARPALIPASAPSVRETEYDGTLMSEAGGRMF